MNERAGLLLGSWKASLLFISAPKIWIRGYGCANPASELDFFSKKEKGKPGTTMSFILGIKFRGHNFILKLSISYLQRCGAASLNTIYSNILAFAFVE